MIQTLLKHWWLLALCGVLNAMISVIYLSHTTHGFAHGPVALLGYLTLAVGACTTAAGIWNLREAKSWLLVLNGLACLRLGVILTFWTHRPVAFRTIALLIVVMALSIGIYQFATVLTLRRHLADEWLVGAAGVISVGFAFAFFAFVLGWMSLIPGSPGQSLYWLGYYFGFSAICILGMAVRPERL